MEIPTENILLYGRSLGSGPSCYLAQKLKNNNAQLGGLILQVIIKHGLRINVID